MRITHAGCESCMRTEGSIECVGCKHSPSISDKRIPIWKRSEWNEISGNGKYVDFILDDSPNIRLIRCYPGVDAGTIDKITALLCPKKHM